jgi:hypothetical protein
MISLCKAFFALDKTLRLIETRRNWMRLTKRYLQSAEYIKIRHSDSQGFQSVQIESAYVYLLTALQKAWTRARTTARMMI